MTRKTDLSLYERNPKDDGNMRHNVYHITTRRVYDQSLRTGLYRPENFETDGFIHCSYADQVAPVAHRFYAGEPDLILLEIDIQKLSYPLVDENLEGGSELFPHIYGELPVDEIGRVYAFQYDDQGQWCLPEGFA